MKEKFKKALPKRLLAFALTVAMAVTLLPVSGRVVKAEESKTYTSGQTVDVKVLKPGDVLKEGVILENSEEYYFAFTDTYKVIYIANESAGSDNEKRLAYVNKVKEKWDNDFDVSGEPKTYGRDEESGELILTDWNRAVVSNSVEDFMNANNIEGSGECVVVDTAGNRDNPTAKAHTDVYVDAVGLKSQGGDTIDVPGFNFVSGTNTLIIDGASVPKDIGSIFTSVDLNIVINGEVELDTIEYVGEDPSAGGVDISINAGTGTPKLTLRGNPELVKVNELIAESEKGNDDEFPVIDNKAFFTAMPAPMDFEIEEGYFNATSAFYIMPIAICNFDMAYAKEHYELSAFPEGKTITISGFDATASSYNGIVASAGNLVVSNSKINDSTFVLDEEIGFGPDPRKNQLSFDAINGDLLIENSVVYPVYTMAGGVFRWNEYEENSDKIISEGRTITIRDSYVESFETTSTGTISVTGAGKAKSGPAFLDNEYFGDANSYEYSFVNAMFLRSKDDLNINNVRVYADSAMAFNDIEVIGENGLLYCGGAMMMSLSTVSAGSFSMVPGVARYAEPETGTANITVDDGAGIITKGAVSAGSSDEGGNTIRIDHQSRVRASGLFQRSMAGDITVDNGSVVELAEDEDFDTDGDIEAVNLNVNNKSLVKTTCVNAYENLSLGNSYLFIIGDGAYIGNFELSDDSQFVSVNDGYPAITVYGEAPDASKFRGTVDAIEGVTLDNVIGSLYSQSSGYVSIDGSKADALGLYNAIEWYEDEHLKSMGSEKTSAIKVGEDLVDASTVIFYPGYSSGNYFPVNTPAATVTPEITVPVSGEGTTNVTAKVEGGNATVSVDTTAINNAAGNTTQDKTDTITVDLSGLAQPVTSVTLSKADAANISNTLNSSANNKEYVEFQMKEYTVKIDSTAMAAVVNAAGGNDLKLVVETTAPAAVLNDNQKAELVGKEVARTFEAYFVSNGTRIGNFNGGSVQVGVVEFKVPAGNDARYYHVEYLPKTGKAERYVTRYMNGYLYFETTHFSDYAIIYDETMVNGSMILVRRLFNKVTGEHLITTDEGEIAYNISTGKWSEDEPMGIAASEGTAVYRLFNKVSGEHLYTADANEVRHHTAGKVWVADNNGDPIFYAPASGKAVYRLFNIKLPGVACHINSADPTEISVLTNKGYVIESDGKPVFYLQ